jgi:hypothetical protein
MDHYRVYKLSGRGGRIVKGKDMHAENDASAMHQACEDPECPVCEVWRGARKVGSVE